MSDNQVSEQDVKASLEEMARASVENLKRIFTTPPLNKSWDEIEERLAKGESLQKILNISDEYMESNYEEAKAKLENEDFSGAKDLFSNLCLYNQTTPKYWGGLAKCCEGLDMYKEAVDCYKMLLVITGGDELLPYMCLGFCYLKLNDKENALDILESGQRIADASDDETRPVLLQIEKLIALCKK